MGFDVRVRTPRAATNRLLVLAALAAILLGAAFPRLVAAMYVNLSSIAMLKVMYHDGCVVFDPVECLGIGASPAVEELLAGARWWDGASESIDRQQGIWDTISGRSEPGIAELSAALGRAGATPVTAMALAAALERSGSHAGAVALWREYRAERVLAGYGANALRAGRSEQALRLYQLAVEVAPGDADVQRRLAGAYRALGQLDQSAIHFRSAFELGLQSEDAAQEFARLLTQRREYAEAEQWLLRALDGRPQDMWLWLELADVYFADQRDAEATAAYAEAVRLAPEYGWARVKYGFFLAHRGQAEQAVAEMGRGLALAPESRESWALLARAYLYALNDPIRASEALDRVIALDPSYPWARFALGQARAAAGDVAAARDAYEQAVALDPSYSDAWAALAGLPGS